MFLTRFCDGLGCWEAGFVTGVAVWGMNSCKIDGGFCHPSRNEVQRAKANRKVTLLWKRVDREVRTWKGQKAICPSLG